MRLTSPNSSAWEDPNRSVTATLHYLAWKSQNSMQFDPCVFSHNSAVSVFPKQYSWTALDAFISRKHRRASQPIRGKLDLKMGFISDLFGGISKIAPNALRRGCELAPSQAPEGLEAATFCGGCFWGLELAYQREPGVIGTSVGYTLGRQANPTYESVCSGVTGHAEAVQVYYDPNETTYERLLDVFFEHVDPTTLNRQGADRGTQYRSAICYHNLEQKAVAEKAIEDVNQKLQKDIFRKVLGSKVVTELQPAGDYYIAEKYHQQYLSRGGRFGLAQSAEKGCKDRIRCYG